MNFFYIPLLEQIKLNCTTCQGLCCNINNALLLEDIQLKLIETKYNFFKKFIFRDDKKNLYLKTPKRCWFLSQKKCSLENNRPIYCKVYPFVFWSFSDTYNYVELLPCPDMPFSNGNDFSISEAIENIEKNKSLIKKRDFPFEEETDLQRINLNIKKIRLLLNDEINQKTETYRMMIALFEQIAMNPIIIWLDFETIKEIFKIYKERLYGYKIDNMQNLYFILKNEILDYCLRQYYIPSMDVKNIKFSYLEMINSNIKIRRKNNVSS